MQERSVVDIRAVLATCPPPHLAEVISGLLSDGRAGVRDAVAAAQRRLARYEAECARLTALAAREHALLDAGMRVVAGVDEVGRGALAGPVSAGACVFDRDVQIEGLNDSKLLPRHARERLYAEIASSARAVAVGHAEPEEIDRVGIAAATVLAMRRAIAGLGLVVDHVLVDGRDVDVGAPATAIVRGDSSVRAIAAAAIYAKVSRDALMRELDATYPGYHLAENKGYGSAEHRAAIVALGPSPVHRRSFGPCSQLGLF